MNRDVKKIGHMMDKDKVTKWVKRYHKEHPDKVRGWLYGCDVLCELLDEDGCDGIWFFKGINDEGKERLIMYPADKDGNILNPKIKSLGAKSNGGGAANDSADCPDDCPGGL